MPQCFYLLPTRICFSKRLDSCWSLCTNRSVFCYNHIQVNLRCDGRAQWQVKEAVHAI